MELAPFHLWLAVCFVSFVAFTYIRILARHGRATPQSRVMEPSTAFAALLAWAEMIATDPARTSFGVADNLGFAIGALGVLLVVLAAFHVPPKRREGKEGDSLQFPTTGVYAHLRHPLFDGLVLCIVGFPMAGGAQLTLLTAPLWSAAVAYWGVLEDQQLAERYGDGFERYRERTYF